MALTAAEQYSLELINRARLNPAAEAARYGVDLNQGLPAGTISSAAKQVLAPNTLLEKAAIGHSQWMLAADVFSHTGSGGSSPAHRVTATGYSWSNLAENLAVRYTSGTINLNKAAAEQHQDLFLSAGHRKNLMNGTYQEIGIAQEQGSFKLGGTNYDSSMVTEVFGRPAAAKAFVTGVVYDDTDKNAFYSIGEGASGASFAAQGKTTTTAGPGGYALSLKAGAAVAVSGKVDGLSFTASVALNVGNVKLDVVNGNAFETSGSLTLGTGINSATLLGVSNLKLTGNAQANTLIGNFGANTIAGGAGADTLRGAAGKDTMTGGDGADKLFGDSGNDRLYGGAGNDVITGGTGVDRMDGGSGADKLIGGTGADNFIFSKGFGHDTAADFVVSTGDRLHLNDALWGGVTLSAAAVVAKYAHVEAGGVVFEFSHDTSVTLTGVTSTTNLASAIMIY